EQALGAAGVVDGQGVLAHEPADAPAEGQPGDAGRGDDPAGRGQPVGMGGLVELAPGHASAGDDRAGSGVDAGVLHQGEVDHEAALGDGLAGDVVAPASDGDLEIGVATEAHGGGDVGTVHAAGNQRGTLVDQPVVDTPNLVVVGGL